MSLDADERLAALRREVDAETASPPATPAPPATLPPSAIPSPPPAPSGPPASAAATTTSSARPAVPSPAKPPPDEPGAPSTSDGWELGELLADTSLATWLGIGLLAVGGYLVLSWFVPGIDLVGSLLILVAGVVVLAQHFMRGAGAWALYVGAVLTGMGAARVIGDILPGSPRGLSAMGIGLAFLAISYLRHTQAGGYGWQGVLGAAAVGLGLVQLLLGLLPGSPSVIDLILPGLLLVGGGLLLVRSRGAARRT